jgi:tetratricopeptide (TPR) repeat protein
VHAWNNLGVAHSHAGRSDLALSALRRALQVDTNFVKSRLNLALLLFKHGEHQRCLETHRQVLQMEPEHPVAWNGVGIVLATLRHFEDARNAFGRAIDARPNYAEAHYNLSFTLSNLGDFAGALRATKRALELDPFYVAQKFELAIDLAFEDPTVNISPDLGMERRDQAIENFSFDPQMLTGLFAELDRPANVGAASTGGSYADARAALASGDIDRAIAEAGRALGGGAGAREGLLLLGDLFARNGAYGEALDRYGQARLLDADGIDALAGEVRMLTLLGRGSEAAEQAELLFERAPGDVDMIRAVARVRAIDGRHDAALEALELARRLAPLRADTVKDIGDVARLMGDDARAVEAYRYAITLDRDYASARVDLASVLTQHGAWDEAEQELEAALVTLPGYTEAALALAALRRTMGRAGDTVDLLVEVLRRDPYHLDALASLGESLFLTGRRADATVAFARVLRFDREHVAALYFEGVMLAEERRYDDAMARWQRVADLEPASDFARRARRDTRTALDLQRIFATREQRGAA